MVVRRRGEAAPVVVACNHQINKAAVLSAQGQGYRSQIAGIHRAGHTVGPVVVLKQRGSGRPAFADVQAPRRLDLAQQVERP